MKQIIADQKHIEKIREALDEVQGKATARTLTAEKILSILDSITKKLGIPKTSMEGVSVFYTGAETFPNAYKYTPYSTHFRAAYRNRHWVIVSIERNICPNREDNAYVALTDAAKDALEKRFSLMSIS